MNIKDLYFIFRKIVLFVLCVVTVTDLIVSDISMWLAVPVGLVLMLVTVDIDEVLNETWF